MSAYNVGDNRPDGMLIGQSATADKVGFYGTTPVVQPTSASQAAVTGTVTATATTTALAADVVLLTTLANQLRTELVALGIIKGS